MSEKKADKRPYRTPELKKREKISQVAEGELIIVTDGGPREPF